MQSIMEAKEEVEVEVEVEAGAKEKEEKGLHVAVRKGTRRDANKSLFK